MDESAIQRSELQLPVVLTALLAAKEKLGIDYMQPEVIYTIGAFGVAYILTRGAVKVARILRTPAATPAPETPPAA